MTRTPEAYALLIEELGAAREHVDSQFAKNREMTRRVDAGNPDEHDWAALGYTLHNLYNAMENYFLRISKFFENGLDAVSWHKDLVDRMALSVPNLRPAFFTNKEYRRVVHELRTFRHVFRNLYDSALDPERVRRVNLLIVPLLEGFRQSHTEFIRKLQEILRAL